MDEQGGNEKLRRQVFGKSDPVVLEILQSASVGIAGAGGLGSNAAISLARSGVGRLVIADFDRVGASDLGRQQYFIDQVGTLKVEALRDILLSVNPFSIYEIHRVRLTRRNIPMIFREVELMIEAFDRAAAKEMLIETWLSQFPGKPIVAASGLAGYGKNNRLKTRRLGNLYICGDEESEPPRGISPMAARVALVANMEANLAVELLVKLRAQNKKVR